MCLSLGWLILLREKWSSSLTRMESSLLTKILRTLSIFSGAYQQLRKNPKNLKHFRALRNAPNVPTAVPKETIDNILNLRWVIRLLKWCFTLTWYSRDNLEIREIKFGYREQSNSFVSEYFLSVCRWTLNSYLYNLKHLQPWKNCEVKI